MSLVPEHPARRRELRILYVGAADGTSGHRAQAFTDLGHHVDVIGLRAPHTVVGHVCVSASSRLKWPIDLFGLNREILSTLRAFSYDLLWVDKGILVRAGTLQSAQRLAPSIKIISYSPDDMRNPANQSKHYLRAVPFYDLHVTTKSFQVSELYAWGARDVQFVDNAFDPRVHRPWSRQRDADGVPPIGVGFVGDFEPARARQIAYLTSHGVSVTVHGSSGSAPWLWTIQSPLFGWRPGVFDDDYARAVSSTKVNLGFLRKTNRDLQTTRTMEIPACGGFLLAERTEEHQRLFEEGREAEYFSSPEELLEKCRYYLERDDERLRVAKAGRRRCIEGGYSNHERLAQILAYAFDRPDYLPAAKAVVAAILKEQSDLAYGDGAATSGGSTIGPAPGARTSVDKPPQSAAAQIRTAGARLGFQASVLASRFLHLPMSRWHETLARSGYSKPAYRWTSDRFGNELRLSPHSHIDRIVLVQGVYERELHSLLNRIVTPGMVVMDVGANIGTVTLHLARLVGASGRVHAFEPAPTVVERLRTHVKRNKLQARVTVHQLALAAKEGVLEFAYADENAENQGMGSLVNRDNAVVERKTRVRVDTLDSVVSRLALTRVDLVKVDIQGAESLFLDGAAATLRRFAPALLMEVSPPDLACAGQVPQDLFDHLGELGYDRAQEVLADGSVRAIPTTDVPRDFGSPAVLWTAPHTRCRTNGSESGAPQHAGRHFVACNERLE